MIIKNMFDNIRAIIINHEKDINVDQIKKRRKKNIERDGKLNR